MGRVQSASMISHEHRCIFIHIPKTAGTSIEKKLGHFHELTAGVQDHRTILQIEPETVPGTLDKVKNWLNAAEEPTEPGKVTARQYRSYFKFTFVRNPWARAFSWYRNIMDDERHQTKHGVPATCSFADFLAQYSDQWAMRPQTRWILDREGNNPLDFTGRFERLQEGFSYVCEKLGLEDSQLPTLMMRPGEQPKYVDAYDQSSIDRIAKRYREEIAMFGYEFGE